MGRSNDIERERSPRGSATVPPTQIDPIYVHDPWVSASLDGVESSTSGIPCAQVEDECMVGVTAVGVGMLADAAPAASLPGVDVIEESSPLQQALLERSKDGRAAEDVDKTDDLFGDFTQQAVATVEAGVACDEVAGDAPVEVALEEVVAAEEEVRLPPPVRKIRPRASMSSTERIAMARSGPRTPPELDSEPEAKNVKVNLADLMDVTLQSDPDLPPPEGTQEALQGSQCEYVGKSASWFENKTAAEENGFRAAEQVLSAEGSANLDDAASDVGGEGSLGNGPSIDLWSSRGRAAAAAGRESDQDMSNGAGYSVEEWRLWNSHWVIAVLTAGSLVFLRATRLVAPSATAVAHRLGLLLTRLPARC